ncbi:hypothetical protein ES705_31376 [subsurface metagenome]
MSYEMVKRVYRQHSSLLIVLPLYLRRSLGIQKGDYVLFRIEDDGDKRVTFSKLDLKGAEHGRDSGNSG